MRTLYISDLDGTLLTPNERLSDFTKSTLNRLIAEGLDFTYATARSSITARKATEGLSLKLPAIVYNGTMAVDSSGEILVRNFLGDAPSLLSELLAHGISPIVYAYIDGAEKFSYVPSESTDGMRKFLASRAGDPRDNPVATIDELFRGEIFYLSCIGAPERLEPLADKFRSRCRVIYSRDTYTDSQWLELMPSDASKSRAAMQLKSRLGYDRLVVFGDGINDNDLFKIADEAYAVANAHASLKALASGIIGSNRDDGVAKFLVKTRENAVK